MVRVVVGVGGWSLIEFLTLHVWWSNKMWDVSAISKSCGHNSLCYINIKARKDRALIRSPFLEHRAQLEVSHATSPKILLTLNALAWCQKGPRLQKRVYLGNEWKEKGKLCWLTFYFRHFSIVNQINDELSMFLRKKIGPPLPCIRWP